MYNETLQKISLYVFKQDRDHTDELIRASVEKYLGLRSERYDSIRITRGAFGAPHLEPEGLPYVSVSHSGNYTVCALSEGQLGVDLQVCHPLRDETAEECAARLLRVAKRFFHPSDTEWIEPDPLNRFFTVWSAKESYVKFTEKGIDDSFSAVRAVPDGGPFSSAWECDGMFYDLLPFEEGYSLCVCTELPSETEIEFVI